MRISGTVFAGLPTLKKRKIMAVFSIDKVERRPVDGYGGKYEVGRDGSVWRNGSRLSVSRGYVNLSHKGVVSTVKVAYLVARAWIPNLEGRKWVRHKNGVSGDDRVDNLEWSEQKEELRGRKFVWDDVSVCKWDTGAFIGKFPSLREACAAVGVREDHARKVLRGELRKARGFVFKVSEV